MIRSLLFAASIACAAFDAAAQTRKVGTIFEATGERGTAYIAASAHANSHVRLELNATAVGALEKSDVIGFEQLPDSPIERSPRAGVNAMISRPAGSSLKDDLPDDLALRLESQLKQLGAPPGAWEMLVTRKTQYAATLLSEMSAVHGRSTRGKVYPSLDDTYRKAAESRSIRATDIEGSLRAYGSLLDVTTDESIAAIRLFAEEMDKPDHQGISDTRLGVVLDAVYAGDLARVREIIEANACMTPLLASRCRKISDARNPFMAEQIDLLVKRGQHPFVAIGALHLTGPNSVLAELERKGYKVRRLQ
ncbi:hypothetical protein DSM104443_01175 [Usitatibacter rugosus]|uniref:TraB family protein n=1 Tax=Usitatibacter rugosus TaxID=2732067 RepID=A0A6M4GS93_9PROT|nr:TraB/GumN family protein [Usitatibacter rugosus]QJR10121.1 hypothetical protein DSM104443_01175 [Usitatibacter rugosus]